MLIKWVATRALELILSRLRATLKDHLSMYPACLQDFKNDLKTLIFQVKIKLEFQSYSDGFLLPKAPGGLRGLKLDETDAANPFLTLPMAKNGLKRPVISQNFPQDSHRFP